MITIVAAYDQLRTIGRDGGLPWQGDLPADLAHFKTVTGGDAQPDNTSVIMGRKTWDSIPNKFKPLKNRENIVVSMTATALKGAIVARSLDEAFTLAQFEPYIIGGGSLYEQALPVANRILATEIFIPDLVDDGDTFFPALPLNEWKRESEELHDADILNKYHYSFVTYIRKHPELLGTY